MTHNSCHSLDGTTSVMEKLSENYIPPRWLIQFFNISTERKFISPTSSHSKIRSLFKNRIVHRWLVSERPYHAFSLFTFENFETVRSVDKFNYSRAHNDSQIKLKSCRKRRVLNIQKGYPILTFSAEKLACINYCDPKKCFRNIVLLKIYKKCRSFYP